MFSIKKTTVTVVALAAVAVGLGTVSVASAAAPAPGTGNIATQQAQRVVDVPGLALGNGAAVTVQVSGKAGVPANATAAFLQLTSYVPSTAGTLTIFTAGTSAPGTPTVQFAKAQENSTTTLVVLDSTGKVTVRATGTTKFLLTALSSVTPAPTPIPGPKGDKGDPGTPGTSAGPVTTTGTTSVSNRADSGDHGNWATDAFSRTLSVTRHAAAPVSNCGVASGDCWFYTAVITDNGSFTTDSGANSPNAGVAIHGIVSGQFNGGEAVEFYASTDTAVQPAATTSGSSPSTTDWVKQDFAAGTHFSTVTTKDGWSWTYTAPATCEQWVDASAAQTGDITGVNACS